MRSIASSVGFVVLFVFVVWLIGALVGFEINLLTTLIASVALTVFGNLILRALR